METTFIPTGSAALDKATGVGGIPRGRLTHIFGSGRAERALAALTYGLVATAQRAGGVCAFVDVDKTIDPAAASRHGVDIENLLISVPDCFEQAADLVEILLRTGAIDVIVVRVGENQASDAPATAARRGARWLRNLQSLAYRFTTALVFVTREMPVSGGLDMPLKFYSSMRVRVSVGEYGAQAKVVKNKCAAPFGEAAIGVGELV